MKIPENENNFENSLTADSVSHVTLSVDITSSHTEHYVWCNWHHWREIKTESA